MPHESEQSRELRAQYRNLRRTAQDVAREVEGNEGANTLYECIEKANSLVDSVKKPREQAVDSSLFLELASSANRIASGLVQNNDRTVTPLTFVKKLRLQFAPGDEPPEMVESQPHLFNWERLGESFSKLFHCVPGVATMNGPMDTQPKQRKTVQRSRKRPLGKCINPDEVNNEAITEQEKQETDRIMKEMWGRMSWEQPVLLTRLVLNHQSFSQTVENLFSLSFLVKDQVAKLLPTPEGIAVLRTKRASAVDFSSGSAENMQFVIPLDMHLWRDLCRRVDPGTCVMSHRDQEPSAAG
uniref:Non-structural maintenance of chromosomes element 4 n=1 Tax=Tetraselmis sp. GSL018 TaxID=582737 RepID=A0A061R5V0_9CHLO|mmetsp:Transcript_43348/g.102811  ORF Transcript_43348/g.102811 Transcript_43348/m.102811 type:complete len:298 (+) Transcript_43348:121-1014(+)